MVGKSGDDDSLLTVKDFVAGTIAGILQVIVGQPFDIIKVRIQAQSPINPIYKNPLDCGLFIEEPFLLWLESEPASQFNSELMKLVKEF